MTRLPAIGLQCLCLLLCAACSTSPKPEPQVITETKVVIKRPPQVGPCQATDFRPVLTGDLLAALQLAVRERDLCASQVQTVVDWQDKNQD